MGVQAADRQFFRSAVQRQAQLAHLVARECVKTAGVDHGAPVDLPECIRVQLRQQFLEWRADQVFLRWRQHPHIFVVRLEINHIGDRDQADS